MVAEQENRLDGKNAPQCEDSNRPESVLMDMRGRVAVGIEMRRGRFLRGRALRSDSLAAGGGAGSLGLGIEFSLDLVDLGFDAKLRENFA
jgi:hypothetical protein